MSTHTTVIIGGVAGGMSAATRLRRLDEERTIIVLERGNEVSFANCGLPYHLGGVIPERSDLVLQRPASLTARFALDVRVRSEVTAIDPDNRTVTVHDLSNDSAYSLRYDSLVLSPGASANGILIPGGNRAHTLRDLSDLDRIMAELSPLARRGGDEKPAAVVIGGGYIGLEVAENLHTAGLAVTIVQRGPQLLSTFDPEMAHPVAEHLVHTGIPVLLNSAVAEITPTAVLLSDGRALSAELVIAATGVTPETELAAAAGLRIGTSGAIWVDEYQHTSAPHIYAIGDAAEKTLAATATPGVVPLAGLANHHGRLVADAIAGIPAPAPRALGTAIVAINGLVAASTGASERMLRALGRPVRVIHTHPSNHVGYYPGGEAMSVKLLVDPATDLLLGAQIVGGVGVDKRIDVLATALAAGLTASALADLELAYAPQFGAAKDPINMIGYINRNQARGQDDTVQWHQLAGELAAGATLLDVRPAPARAEGTIPGALHIPLDELRTRAAEVPTGRLVVHCRVGHSAHNAQRLLAQRGHSVVNLDGGYLTWRAGTAGTHPAAVAATTPARPAQSTASASASASAQEISI
ncbi:FAD-dependent oxidoreductase [Klugiella xanthotipulae]|uniref:NADPH-dependent 2,4-dienoyl-CoA reductase/sulfur reductase-like enzyme n=1 Tax=Klugiella xanthotipulae TaxID=244735 RepID=A0A543I5S3_9MICO|nr:FAD-dependent oxidoreductase [Klugiella xanthotipulae]TQM65952.1 NADPH-dependent 2,4-dienoyl-CoA reductase/sulfur reductase-like enzyme [Klugiella xanthotipulae]